jgi:hypothetical protein
MYIHICYTVYVCTFVYLMYMHGICTCLAFPLVYLSSTSSESPMYVFSSNLVSKLLKYLHFHSQLDQFPVLA